MKIFHGFNETLGQLSGCTVALGNFDGVHLGHQVLMRKVLELARKEKRLGAVATFEPHPEKILSPRFEPILLTPLPRKIELLNSLGLDAIVLQKFDCDYARLTARDFMERDLLQFLQPHRIVVGSDFGFGHNRNGNIKQLREACDARNIELIIFPPVICEQGEVVSSTRIRKLVIEGELEAAAKLLNRPVDVAGKIVSGWGRGRKLGFPTANMQLENEVCPGPGVYAVRVFLNNRIHGGVANIGRKPTFGDEEITFEIHLFDFSEDLYGRRLAVELLKRLRMEERFSSVGELVDAIKNDCKKAKEIIDHAPPPGLLSPHFGKL